MYRRVSKGGGSIKNKHKVITFIAICIIFISAAVMLNINQFMTALPSQNMSTGDIFQEGITLLQDEAILNVGDSFNAKDYVDSAYDENGNDLKEEIVINEFIDTSEEAEYIVSYIIQNEDGYIRYKKDLHVIVAE